MRLNNVRVRYESIYKPSAFGDKEPKFEITVMMGGDHPQLGEIRKLLKEAKVDKFGEKETKLNHQPLRKSEEKEDKGHFIEDGFFIKATANAESRPRIYDREQNPIGTEDSVRVYAGCWVNLLVDFWGWEHSASHNKGLSATLRGVQFSEDDESLSGPAPAKPDDFDNLGAGDEKPTSGGDKVTEDDDMFD